MIKCVIWPVPSRSAASSAAAVAWPRSPLRCTHPTLCASCLQIGRGSFAVVLRCFRHATSTSAGAAAEGSDRGGLAAKKLPRYVHGRLPAQQFAIVAAEAAAQAALCAASPSILRLVDFRADDTFFYLIQELCLMDLGAWLQQRGGPPLPGREAACIVQQLLCALRRV